MEKDGIRMHAICRDVHVERSKMPLSDGNISFFFRDDIIFECAAYELAKLLGLDTVPLQWGVKFEANRERCKPGSRTSPPRKL